METERLIKVLKAVKKLEYEDYCFWKNDYDDITAAIKNLDMYDNLERYVDLIESKSLTKINLERQKAICSLLELLIEYIEIGCHSQLYTLFGEKIEKIIKEEQLKNDKL